MRLKFFGFALTAALALTAGCGGQYITTLPDQVAAAGGDITVVARLQRNDFFVLDLPMQGAHLRFKIADGLERVASTDKLGYAGVRLALPEAPGRYELTVKHQDIDGDEAAVAVAAYVWDPDKPVIAVDMDPLPRRRSQLSPKRTEWWAGLAKYTVDMLPRPVPADAASAREALARLAKQGNILYLTRRSAASRLQCHDELAEHGYPDGPVLMWRRQRWHIVPGRYRIPRVVVESRLVSQIAELKKMFPKMSVGLSTSSLAAKAFVDAGMTAAVVGNAGVKGDKIVPVASWKELAEKGL